LALIHNALYFEDIPFINSSISVKLFLAEGVDGIVEELFQLILVFVVTVLKFVEFFKDFLALILYLINLFILLILGALQGVCDSLLFSDSIFHLQEVVFIILKLLAGEFIEMLDPSNSESRLTGHSFL